MLTAEQLTEQLPLSSETSNHMDLTGCELPDGHFWLRHAAAMSDGAGDNPEEDHKDVLRVEELMTSVTF